MPTSAPLRRRPIDSGTEPHLVSRSDGAAVHDAPRPPHRMGEVGDDSTVRGPVPARTDEPPDGEPVPPPGPPLEEERPGRQWVFRTTVRGGRTARDGPGPPEHQWRYFMARFLRGTTL